MADIRFSSAKQVLGACTLLSAAALASCSSVERTPMDKMSALQSVMPVAKPGTEMTAYALPTPDGTPTPVMQATTALANRAAPAGTGIVTADQLTASPSALLETKTVQTPGEKAIEAAALSTTGAADPTSAAAVVAATDPALPAAANTTISIEKVSVPRLPEGVTIAAMDSDFDTGEPVGLETLVSKRMIVPMPKPRLIAAAYARVESAAKSLLGAEKPTSSRPELDLLITRYAKLNGLPEDLVHRVVKRESTYNPRAYHNGNYGLMQIRYNTARGLGYDGPPEGLFDAETNLKYATQYLRGAWVVAENQNDNAVRLYASGYYYHAKRKGLLDTLNMR